MKKKKRNKEILGCFYSKDGQKGATLGGYIPPSRGTPQGGHRSGAGMQEPRYQGAPLPGCSAPASRLSSASPEQRLPQRPATSLQTQRSGGPSSPRPPSPQPGPPRCSPTEPVAPPARSGPTGPSPRRGPPAAPPWAAPAQLRSAGRSRGSFRPRRGCAPSAPGGPPAPGLLGCAFPPAARSPEPVRPCGSGRESSSVGLQTSKIKGKRVLLVAWISN